MYFVYLRGLVSRPGIKPCMIQYCMLSLVYLPYFCTLYIQYTYSIQCNTQTKLCVTQYNYCKVSKVWNVLFSIYSAVIYRSLQWRTPKSTRERDCRLCVTQLMTWCFKVLYYFNCFITENPMSVLLTLTDLGLSH